MKGWKTHKKERDGRKEKDRREKIMMEESKYKETEGGSRRGGIIKNMEKEINDTKNITELY